MRGRRILLSLVYVAFLLLLFEGTARAAFSVPQIAKRLHADEDNSWRRYWVQRHRRTGTEIFYTFDTFDPVKGWISKPNLRGVSVFGDEILNTNSKGFRGTVDFPHERNKDRVRILLLGDSFTFGDEVSDEETWSHYLQQALPEAEVINLGVHGYGHDQMLILLREEGVHFRPDVVVLGFVGMDMPRNLLGFRDFAKPRFVLRKDGALSLTGTPVPRPEEVLRGNWKRLRVADVAALVRFRAREFRGVYRRDMEMITGAIVKEFVHVVDSAGAVPVIAYLPEGGEDLTEGALNRDEDFMFSLCRALPKARCMSARPWFIDQVKRGRTFKLTRHWEPAGHRTAAAAIGGFLVESGYMRRTPAAD